MQVIISAMRHWVIGLATLMDLVIMSAKNVTTPGNVPMVLTKWVVSWIYENYNHEVLS